MINVFNATINVHFDGGCLLYQHATWGFVVSTFRDGVLYEQGGQVPCKPEKATSNVAEHYALYRALSYLCDHYKNDPIDVYGDSKLVINQIFKRNWTIKNRELPYAPYAIANLNLVMRFSDITGSHIPREYNQYADSLTRIYPSYIGGEDCTVTESKRETKVVGDSALTGVHCTKRPSQTNLFQEDSM